MVTTLISLITSRKNNNAKLVHFLCPPPELILKGQEYLDAVAKNVGSAPSVKPEALLDTVDESFLNEQQPEGTTATILGNI